MGGRLELETGSYYEDDDDYPGWNPWELKLRYACYERPQDKRETDTKGDTMKHGKDKQTDD